MASIHSRMPVILKREDEWRWIEPAPDASTDPYRAMLRPYPAELMSAYPVSALVNSFQNEGPGLLEPATPAASSQLSLF
jgi:putative SOS response-associated peptidase YedK